jgi:periplasmic divalent cation tolerance protein
METQFVQLQTTTGSQTVAERITTELVERGLVACVQVLGPVRSTYRWDGKEEHADEYLMLIKTSVAVLAEVKATIARLHPYDVPEVIATPIVDGSEGYLKWLGESITGQ